MRLLLSLIVLLFVAPITAQDNKTIDFDYEYGDIRRLYIENKLDSAEQKLKQLQKKLFSLDDSQFPAKEYAYIICNLSDIYVRQNKFKESELIIDVAEKKLQLLGEQAFSQRKILLTQKGNIKLMIEDVEGAKNTFFQAKKLFEKDGDNTSVDYALCVNGLAMTYQKRGDYCISNILFNAVINIFINISSSFGVDKVNDSRYLAAWINVAQNFEYMGDIERANDIRTEIIKSGKNQNGSESCLALLDSAYEEIQKGNFETAIQMIDNGECYGSINKEEVYLKMILLLYLSNNKRVIDFLRHYINYSKNSLSSILMTYAESEWENYWSQRSLALEAVTNAVSWKYQTPELLQEAFNLSLFTKGLLMRFSKIISDIAKNSSSNEIDNKFALISKLKRRIISKGTPTDSAIILQERIKMTERELIMSIPDYNEIFDDSKYNCKNIRKALKPGEVAIEYVLLPVFQSPILNEGLAYYGALIERPEYDYPKIVKLCELDSLDDVMSKGNLLEGVFIDSLYSLNDEKLYSLVFRPLEKYLYVGETIYYSPVRSLHKVNLQAIPINGQRLMDKYNLIEVSSTAQLLDSNWRETQEQISDAFLMGGIDYSMDTEDMALEALHYVRYRTNTYVATRSSNRGSWDPIPETLIEAQQIDSILCNKKINTVFLSGGKANEEAFKNLDGNSPDIIHLATHGFFYEEKDDTTTPFFENTNSYANKRLPMQFSGLLLSGANNAWIGKLPPTNIEDGILTAEEISLLDLTHTKIAVLSACDTGLGEVDDIDGVYGLQRGFKMAGVETLVMSLWKIPDDATRILMVEFYKNLMSGKSKHQSLKDAQKYLREVDNGKYDDPKYWAAFIMLDGLN